MGNIAHRKEGRPSSNSSSVCVTVALPKERRKYSIRILCSRALRMSALVPMTFKLLPVVAYFSSGTVQWLNSSNELCAVATEFHSKWVPVIKQKLDLCELVRL